MIAQSVDLARLMAHDMPPMQRAAHPEARHWPAGGLATAVMNRGEPPLQTLARQRSPAVRRPSEELD
jgi:hypothetical protein